VVAELPLPLQGDTWTATGAAADASWIQRRCLCLRPKEAVGRPGGRERLAGEAAAMKQVLDRNPATAVQLREKELRRPRIAAEPQGTRELVVAEVGLET